MSRSFRRIALVNPPWEFEGSRYWACRETHLPLELLYGEALLKQSGLFAQVVDAHLEALTLDGVAERVGRLDPDLIVVTTAPTYLFWRCPPPDLEVPRAVAAVLRGIAPLLAIGPHGSATPHHVLRQLDCQAVIRGEPELELVRVAEGRPSAATVWRGQSGQGGIDAVPMDRLPTLDYRDYPLERRVHRHHLFWGTGKGSEVELSRGCPYGCSFCNRRFFRGRYRERPLGAVLSEMRTLKSRGVDYVYFIDEVFGLGRCDDLLRSLSDDPIVSFGCQTRIDLWNESRIERLAAAGCVSLELGLESPFPEAQRSINKGYSIDAGRILELMVYAKARIPWVQGDLIEVPGASADLRRRTAEWRQQAIDRGVWVSDPVPVFLYPGCDLYEERIGPVDDEAWTKATTCGS